MKKNRPMAYREPKNRTNYPGMLLCMVMCAALITGPWLFVWMIWILLGQSFELRDVFSGDGFIAMTLCYEVFFGWLGALAFWDDKKKRGWSW
jgi:hypothetical protein